MQKRKQHSALKFPKATKVTFRHEIDESSIAIWDERIPDNLAQPAEFRVNDEKLMLFF